MKRTKIKILLTEKLVRKKPVLIKGWVKTKRESRHVVFININDGSTVNNIQVVADPNIFSEELLKDITTGACLSVKGEVVPSQGNKQKIDLAATHIQILGKADPEEYPLQPKKHSFEFLREIAYLRPRTDTFGAVFRIRHHLAFAVHKFFNDRGFVNVHTPIITGSDAEGVGEMFRVTTIDPKKPPLTEDGNVDYKQDFFGKETSLTVSGQLEGELFALALGEIYTFGPTFRAENSNTTRHLAEFWMIEPEMAFYELKDNIDIAEEFLKYLVEFILEKCSEDLEFLNKKLLDEDKNKPANERSEMSLIERLNFIIDNKFERLTYTEAIEILKNSKPNKKKRFKYLINGWGADLQSEHERFLVEKHFKKPVILTDYPKDIKAFYMKLNDDGKTVKAMDILFPSVGEIVGGSQREESYDKLRNRCAEMHIPEKDVWWYMNTRKFGTAPHSGFGLGFERMVLFVTGMSNIRDVMPFPRTPGNADF